MKPLSSLQIFITKRPYLNWYISSAEDLSEGMIVEHTLQYGDWKDFHELCNILTLERVAKLFFEQISKKRVNYSPKTAHFFKLYFKAHVSSLNE